MPIDDTSDDNNHDEDDDDDNDDDDDDDDEDIAFRIPKKLLTTLVGAYWILIDSLSYDSRPPGGWHACVCSPITTLYHNKTGSGFRS